MSKTVKTKKREGKRGSKTLAFFILIIAAVTIAPGETRPSSWNVALFGGGNLGRNGDAGKFIRDYERYYENWAEAYGTTKSGSLDWPGAGMEYGGEIGYSLSSRFSVGVAVERLSKKMEGSFTLGQRDSHAMEMMLSAVSISASGRYAVPLTKAVAIFFRTRLGAIFGSLTRTLDRLEPNAANSLLLLEADYSATGLTGQAGFGLEWELSPRLSLQSEGGYRMTALPKWSGNAVYQKRWGNDMVTERGSGHLYYEEIQRDTERIPTIYHPSLTLGTPEGHVWITRRDFKAGFTGFFFKAGIVFRFGR